MDIKTASGCQRSSITLDLEALNYLCIEEVNQDEIMQVIKPTLLHVIRLKMDNSWPLREVVRKYAAHLRLVESDSDLSDTDALYRVPVAAIMNYLLKRISDEDLFRILTTH